MASRMSTWTRLSLHSSRPSITINFGKEFKVDDTKRKGWTQAGNYITNLLTRFDNLAEQTTRSNQTTGSDNIRPLLIVISKGMNLSLDIFF